MQLNVELKTSACNFLFFILSVFLLKAALVNILNFLLLCNLIKQVIYVMLMSVFLPCSLKYSQVEGCSCSEHALQKCIHFSLVKHIYI